MKWKNYFLGFEDWEREYLRHYLELLDGKEISQGTLDKMLMEIAEQGNVQGIKYLD